jgi:hypothetical protein
MKRVFPKPPPNTACSGRLRLGAFFELLRGFGSFPFPAFSSPAAGNASRWALRISSDNLIDK